MGIGLGPRQARGIGGGVAQDAANALLQGQAIGPAAVQALHHGVETIPQALHLGGLDQPFLFIEAVAGVPGALQLLEHLGLGGLARMQLQAEFAEPLGLQAAIHHVQRRALLGDEQDPPAERQIVGDHVGDGLGLAGAGRAVEDEILAAGRGEYRRQLRRIRRQRGEKFGRSHLAIQLALARKAAAAEVGAGFAGALQQVPHQRAFHQLVAALGEVLPHQVLGEGELTEQQLAAHLEAGQVAHRAADLGPDPVHVDAVAIPGQGAIEPGNVQVEIVAQQFQQGEVEARLVLEQVQGDAAGGALPFQAHRQQDQRGTVMLGIVGGLFPAQETQRQVEGIGTALVEVAAGAPIELYQGRVQLGRIQGGDHLAAGQGTAGVLVLQILVFTRLVQHRVATAYRQVRQRHQAQRPALGQAIFQRRRLGAEQGHAAGVFRHVQQAVAGGEVEQLALPKRQATDRGGRCGLDVHVEGWQRRGLFQGFARQQQAVQGGGELSGHRQWADALQAGATDVQGQHETVVFQLALGQLHRLAEGRRRGGGGLGGLEYQQVLERHPLAHRLGVVGEQLGEFLGLQPDPGERMTVGDHQQRVEARLFQGRAGEQREIQAGGQATVEDGAGRADLLALALEAGRRHCVGQLQAAQGRPERRTELPDPAARLPLVTIQRRGLAGAAQDLGGSA